MKLNQAVTGTKLEHPAGIIELSLTGLADLGDQIREDIARRAYEIFERRGRVHAYDLADWFQAESEIVCHLPSDIRVSADQILVRINLMGVDPNALQVGVEPRRIILRGGKPLPHDVGIGALGYNGNTGETICFLDLPTEVDEAKAKAVIKGPVLEVTAKKLRT